MFDNATVFTNSEFAAYCKKCGIAPGHPATNGQAERFVQTLKLCLESSTVPLPILVHNILLCYRANHSTVKSYLPNYICTAAYVFN